MELAEVVLQGVKGSPQLSRWVFGSGVCVVPAGDKERLVARAAYELLAGITDGHVASAVLPGEAGAQGRAGVVVVGRDQRRYRVLWDLTSGRRALQVQNADKFEVITTTQAEILQALTATVGFPQQDSLKELFFSFVDDLPSRRTDLVVADSGKNPKAPQKSGASTPGFSSSGKPLPPGFGDAAPSKKESDKPLPPGFDFEEKKAPTSRWLGRPEHELRDRLDEIARATSSQVDVSALEFELDGLQKRVFEIDGRLKPLLELQKNVDTLDNQLNRYVYLDLLPVDFLDQANALQKAKSDHEGGLERLQGERERLVEAADHLSDEVSGIRRRGGPRPVQAAMQDPLVKFGVAGGVAAIVLATLGGFANDSLRWLAFLNIPAFGAAVFGGIRLLSGLEEGASFRLKLARVDGEKKKVEERFAIDKEQIARLLERAQLTPEQLPDVQEQWRLRDDIQGRRRQAVASRDAAQETGDLQTLKGEQDQVRARISQLEEQLQTAGRGFDPETTELLKEKDEIDRILSGELRADEQADLDDAPKPTLDDLMGPSSSSSASSSSSSSSSGAAAPLAYDVGQRIVRIASDVLLASIDDTMTRLGPRASQMVQALTDRRFSEVRFGSKAEVSVVDASSSQALPYTQLPGVDRDLIALALRLATVEAFAKTNRMPVVFDQVFDVFPVEQSALFVRVLQFLGQSTQVVCLTARREMAGAGPVVTAG